MTEFLLRLGIMSLQATVIIFVVLILRLIFSKLHIAKKYTNLLWVIPYIAMILPWGIESPVSFWHITQESQAKIERTVHTMPYMAEDLMQEEISPEVMQEMIDNRYAPPTLDDLADNKDKTDGDIIADITYNSASNLSGVTTWDVFIWVMFAIWLLGVAIFLLHGVVGSLKLRKKLVCSLLIKENVYVADDIKEPFVFGVFSPKIYLPYNLTRNDEYYVVEHEKTHIRRKDPIKKIIAFIITGIHWFNPFAWLAFHMMTKDMEMACDEETVQRIGLDTRKEYATALLKLSTKKRNLLIPVAFGEGNVKSRINNVLKYKKTIKVLAVIAAVLIILVAVVFLTKPIDRVRTMEDIRFLDNHDELMRPPVEGRPRRIIVIYEGVEYTFDDSFYDTFRIFLEELELYEVSINKSRSEDRPKEVVIQIEGGAAYNFDEKMETIWCNDRVKPSFSYEVVSPKEAIQFITAQIAVCKGNPSVYDEDIQQSEEEFSLTDVGVCGENGPFLDYADERYVVFHTTDWFYVYDIVLEDMIWGVGLNNITDVEVDTKILKAYIHDIVGDGIYIYACDIANESYTQVKVLPNINQFQDFLVTNECVLQDVTVYRTKECVQIAGGEYLYLESGSGLLKDLRLVIEDKLGNKEAVNMFVYTTSYSGKQDKAIQMLTEGEYIELQDITHDGEMEYIVVDFEEIQEDKQKSAYLKVMDKQGNIIWEKEMFLATAGWDSYYLVESETGKCIMQYLPLYHLDKGEYSYRVFYLNEDGSEIEVASESVSFVPYPLDEKVSAKEAIPKEEMVQFANNVNIFFDGARLLVSTVDGELRYQTPGITYSYKELYQVTPNITGLEYSENIELNITKLQNYYERER